MTSIVGGLSLWLAAVHACGHLSHASLAGVSPLPFSIAVLGVSSSYIVYALVWYNTEAFIRGCKGAPLRLLGSNPISVFQSLVLSFKLVQQCTLFGWAAHVLGASLLSPASIGAALMPLAHSFAADAGRVATAAALIVAGQTLNAGIYAAIGKNGVYYGFKLGAQVPWCDGFPFNLGYRHPQYVGGTLSQYAVFAVLSSRETMAAGLLPLLVWWTVNYALVSWMEASSDNDAQEGSRKEEKKK